MSGGADVQRCERGADGGVSVNRDTVFKFLGQAERNAREARRAATDIAERKTRLECLRDVVAVLRDVADGIERYYARPLEEEGETAETPTREKLRRELESFQDREMRRLRESLPERK